MKTMINFLVLILLTCSVNAQTAEEVIQKYYEATNAKETFQYDNIVRKVTVNMGIVKSSAYVFYNIKTGEFKEVIYTKGFGQLTFDMRLLSHDMGFKYNANNSWERQSIKKENYTKRDAQGLMYLPRQKSYADYDITYMGIEKRKHKVKFENNNTRVVSIYYFDTKSHLISMIEHIIDGTQVKEKIKKYKKFNSVFLPSVTKVIGVKAKFPIHWFNVDLPEDFFEPDEMTNYGGAVSEEELLKLLKSGKKYHGMIEKKP